MRERPVSGDIAPPVGGTVERMNPARDNATVDGASARVEATSAPAQSADTATQGEVAEASPVNAGGTDAVSNDAASDKSASKAAASDEAASGDAASDDAAADGTIMNHPTTNHTTPNGTAATTDDGTVDDPGGVVVPFRTGPNARNSAKRHTTSSSENSTDAAKGPAGGVAPSERGPGSRPSPGRTPRPTSAPAVIGPHATGSPAAGQPVAPTDTAATAEDHSGTGGPQTSGDRTPGGTDDATGAGTAAAHGPNDGPGGGRAGTANRPDSAPARGGNPPRPVTSLPGVAHPNGSPAGPGFGLAAAPTGRRVRARLARFNAPWQTPSVSEALEPLIANHRSSHPKADIRVLQRAYDTAARWHNGQYRKSGDPYITHPLAVAGILAELGMDTTTLVAALLHDTIEDTAYTIEQMRDDFGGEVALLVDGVTKLDRVKLGDAAKAETIRKMVVAMAKDPRVLVIKLADRLHNMRTLTFLPVPSRNRRPRRRWRSSRRWPTGSV